MTTDTHKAAFTAAAAAAKELLAGVQEKREKIAKQLASLDEQVMRLEIVISMSEPAQAREQLAAAASGEVKRPKKHDWVAAIGAVLAQFPMGLTFNDMVEQLRKKHGFDHSKVHIQKLLERGEARGALRRDDERRWFIVKNAMPQSNGAKKSPWHSLPGANA